MPEQTFPPIETKRLSLVCMPPAFLQASIAGDKAAAERAIGLSLPDEWVRHTPWMERRIAQLHEDPSLQEWLLRAIVLKGQKAMIGRVGFHSGPSPDYLKNIAAGGIEFGIDILSPYRRQGFGTEACAGLMDWARTRHGVHTFVVSIRPDNEPSLRIAKGFGFRKVGEQMDDIDGLEHIFVLDGPQKS